MWQVVDHHTLFLPLGYAASKNIAAITTKRYRYCPCKLQAQPGQMGLSPKGT